MYVRSHIDTVSGDRKYIYIDENNKKYIRDKNKYYPIKKYKGVYTLQKIRGGAGGASIDVKLYLYGIKGADGKVDKDARIFDTTIDLSNIVLNTDDDTYKNIIKDNKIYIFNKGFASIDTTIQSILKSDSGVITQYGSIIINHYVIIKDNSSFKVYFKKITQYTINKINVLLKNYVSFYNIIYKRNNKIDSNSNQGEYFLTIFSITEDDIKVNDELQSYIPHKDPIYNKLYDSTLDKLKETYR